MFVCLVHPLWLEMRQCVPQSNENLDVLIRSGTTIHGGFAQEQERKLKLFKYRLLLVRLPQIVNNSGEYSGKTVFRSENNSFAYASKLATVVRMQAIAG